MECNKEEAIRAKGIAEKKMQNKDFVGARKIALKAQQLFPELDNISQMLTVCNVHCSAEQKILGSESNWYAILQIEQTADEALIKKQYRKLALLLHPDKNKFSGAEAAFKMIGEAQRVLSDQSKRTTFDMKLRASLRTAVPNQPPQQLNRSTFIRPQAGVQNNFVNIVPQCTGPNSQQQTQPRFANGRPTFWTICPFCGIRYQYYREIINRTLRCQNCSKAFIAHDLDAQGSQPGASCTRPVFPQQKKDPIQGAHKVGPQAQSTVGNPPTSSKGFRGNIGTGTASSEPSQKTESNSEFGLRSKKKGKENANLHMGAEIGKDGAQRSNFEEEKAEELKPSGNTSRKRRRKSDMESSDCGDSGSSIEENVILEGVDLPAGQNLEGYYCRRSTRQKQHVSYNENLSEDDLTNPSKRSRGSGLSSDPKEQKARVFRSDVSVGSSAVMEEDMEVTQKSTLHGESLPNGAEKVEQCKANGKETSAEDGRKERSKDNDETESDSSKKTTPDPEYIVYPDPDFNDFDKEREEERFAADQIWAVYDTVDGMPRFYARVRKVFSSGFKLRITWLETDPDDEDEIDWVSEDLPVACGKFKHGKSEETADRLMFSHHIWWEKGSTRGSYKVYPRKGETWAIFKNWDIKWNSDPDNHRQYEYEFVEILSEYVEEIGIIVGYLGKVYGFVSLFRRTVKGGVESFQIPPGDLFRFSHRVPSFRMAGKEREGVPEGSYELDPASLPPKVEDFVHPNDVKVDVESRGSKVDVSCSKSMEDKVSPMTRSEKPDVAKKSIDLKEKKVFEKGGMKSENKSFAELNGNHRMFGQAKESQCEAKEQTSKHLGASKPGSHVGSASTCEVDGKDTGRKSCAEDSKPPPSSYPEAHEIPEPEFYTFEADKSPEKFQPGQIWALYSDEDGMPRYYGRIKKIESSPDFKLHLAWLKACSAPENLIQWHDKNMLISCGMFKLNNGKAKVYLCTNSFSHQLKAEPIAKKNNYNIYPRKGEVWALYRNWNAEWTCSDLENLEYDIVEVLGDNDLQMKVMVLVRVNGFKTVFKAQRKGKSNVTMNIPRTELLRFSHQIPAFRLTEERNGSLKGCWELDPAAIPFILLCSD